MSKNSLLSSIASPKSSALLLLIFQNAGLILLMRYTFLYSKQTNSPIYLSSTAVILSEILKFFIASYLSFWLDCNFNWNLFLSKVSFELLNLQDLVHILVPSLLYTIQNSLQYYAMSSLSAPVFQVFYQMKVITTAFFTVLLLRKKLFFIQWVSIFLLTIGVICVQLSQSNKSNNDNNSSQEEKIFGIIAVIVSCFTSGFAGVYFELFLKTSTNSSIWMRNIQMSFIGIFFATFSTYVKDFQHIYDGGFFQGYNNWVVLVIILQAIGGMLVALVLKYADNVLKGFATSISIIISIVFSYFYFNEVDINILFLIGTCTVFTSVFLYGHVPSSSSTPSTTSSSPS